MTFSTGAWVAWLVAATAIVFSVDSPVASLAVIGASVAIAARIPRAGATTVATMLRLGLLFTVIRTVLFALTGHTGATTVVTLPSLRLPAVLGGFDLGGRVTAEVLAHSATEGLRLAAMLTCLGVFLTAVSIPRLMRSLPQSLFEAGLIIGIAVTFVPVMLRTAVEVRDAQRLRGHRVRGLRSVVPLVVPVLDGALERSMTLAASMESRGYGRRGVRRTRYRLERTTRWDLAFIATAVGAAFAAVPARAAAWSAYPVLAAPSLHPALLAPLALLLAPLLFEQVRATQISRAAALAEARA